MAFSDLTVRDLRAELKKRGLRRSGLKVELIARLEEFEAQAAESSAAESTPEKPSPKKATPKKASPKARRRASRTPEPVEESEDSEPVAASDESVEEAEDSEPVEASDESVEESEDSEPTVEADGSVEEPNESEQDDDESEVEQNDAAPDEPSPRSATPKSRASPRKSSPRRSPAKSAGAKSGETRGNDAGTNAREPVLSLQFSALIIALATSGLALIPLVVQMLNHPGVYISTSRLFTALDPLIPFEVTKEQVEQGYLTCMAIFAVVRVAAGLNLSASRSKFLYAVAFLSFVVNALITAAMHDSGAFPTSVHPYVVDGVMGVWMALGAPYYLLS